MTRFLRPFRRVAPVPIACVVAVFVAACAGSTKHVTSPTTRRGAHASTTAAPTTLAPTTTVPPTTTSTTVPPTVATTTSTAPPRRASATNTPVATGGRVVVIDPGHNGGNAQHTAEVNRLVDIGNGMKPCNTTGAETNDGYPEHAFTWDVALRVAAHLRAAGVRVVLTRPNDTGWGPCSVDRAAIANRAHALAAVSIHADGGPAGGRGFHVIEPALLAGLTDDIFSASARLGTDVHDALVTDTPMPPSTYAGSNGYMVRSDLGGLNRADVPAIFVECGNMRNATDASMLESTGFREQLATALTAGILRYIS